MVAEDADQLEMYGYKGLLSLYAVCASKPSSLKKEVDDLLQRSDAKIAVVKVVFLYFF